MTVDGRCSGVRTSWFSHTPLFGFSRGICHCHAMSVTQIFNSCRKLIIPTRSARIRSEDSVWPKYRVVTMDYVHSLSLTKYPIQIQFSPVGRTSTVTLIWHYLFNLPVRRLSKLSRKLSFHNIASRSISKVIIPAFFHGKALHRGAFRTVTYSETFRCYPPRHNCTVRADSYSYSAVFRSFEFLL